MSFQIWPLESTHAYFCCIENFPPTCGSHEFRRTFEEGRARRACAEPLTWQMVPEGFDEFSPGRLPMDRFCAWHSGPWTSRSVALIFFFFNYLTEDVPLTDYETLNACLSTGIPLKGVFCFLQNISLQKSHQLWAWEPLSPFKLEEESGFAVATKACFLILCGYSSFAIFRGWDGECSGLTEI